MSSKITKNSCLATIALCAFLTVLSAQRPTLTSRIFYPADASTTFLSLAMAPLSMLSDSGFMSSGVLNQTRFLSRFDKNGNHLWSKMHQNDSLVSRMAYTKTADGFAFLGFFAPDGSSSLPRPFLAKLDLNGNVTWSRVFSVPPLIFTGSSSVAATLAVATNGSILIAYNGGSNDVWQTYYYLVNANGSLSKSWTFNEIGRPNVYPTLDGGFIIGSSITVGGLQNGQMSNLRLIRLNANGDIQWSKYFASSNAGTLGGTLGRIVQMPDSSFVMAYGNSVTRLSTTGSLVWSKTRAFNATPGFVFSTSTLVNSSLFVSSTNKIYTFSAPLETGSIGVGRETPVINEFNAETGEHKSYGYPNTSGRPNSMLEIANGGGFWIMSDTVVPLGVNQTRNVTSRLMRTNAQFDAGCGAPLSVNTTPFNTNFVEALPLIGVTATAFNPQNYAPTTSTTAASVVFSIKGECPSSLTGTDDLATALPVSVYPNPNFGDFVVESEEADILQLQVFDVIGRLLQTHKNVGQKGPLSINRSGTYFLQIETAKGRVFKKVFVDK